MSEIVAFVAVILAQVLIAAWEEYRDARAVAGDEANAVLNLARLAQIWSQDDRLDVEVPLSSYADLLVESNGRQWPLVSSKSHCTRSSSIIYGSRSTALGFARATATRRTRRRCSSWMRWTKRAAAGCS